MMIVLGLEFVALFILLPLGIRFSPRPLPVLPVLWLATLYCYLVLRHDVNFDQRQLWNAPAATSAIAPILLAFLVLGSLIVLAVRLRAPQLWFGLVRTRPGIWAAVMVLYPVLSVYPQGLVYRAFLMHRYLPLAAAVTSSGEERQLIILVSAAAFGFMHLIFRNPVAPAMTFLGGILFAWRYQTTHSLAASSFEHALYGCLLFTVGLGEYFYHGRMRLR